MALTLLVESGHLGSGASRLKHFCQRQWVRMRGGAGQRRLQQRDGYAALAAAEDLEQGVDDEGIEDEDVKAERVMLQTGM